MYLNKQDGINRAGNIHALKLRICTPYHFDYKNVLFPGSFGWSFSKGNKTTKGQKKNTKTKKKKTKE